MDTRDGRIYHGPQVAIMAAVLAPHVRPMVLEPTPAQLSRGKVGRNDPCPCDSGRKFKRCCLARQPAPRAELELAKQAAERMGRELAAAAG